MIDVLGHGDTDHGAGSKHSNTTGKSHVGFQVWRGVQVFRVQWLGIQLPRHCDPAIGLRIMSALVKGSGARDPGVRVFPAFSANIPPTSPGLKRFCKKCFHPVSRVQAKPS